MTGIRKCKGILLAAILLSVSLLCPMSAEAGVSKEVRDKKTLDEANWSNPEADVYAKDGKLIFSEGSTEYSRFITKTAAKKSTLFETMVEVSTNMKITKMPSGKSFIIAFGLSGIEAMHGEANNVEVSFVQNGGIKLGITAYDEGGKAITVVSPRASGISLNQEASIAIVLKVDGQISVSINGNEVCKAQIPVSGEGRVGFMQTGNVAVELSEVNVASYKYDTPENPNVEEDFEKGALDISKLTASIFDFRGFFPRGQVVEEYNGSHVLMFRNTLQAYLGTLYQYSNFEMSFDVPYYQANDIYNEDGKLILPGSSSFAVAFGGEQADWTTDGWKSAKEAVVFGKASVYSYNNKEEIVKEYDTHKYLTDKTGGFSVKLSAVDGVVTVGMKWMEEEQYQTMLSYTLKNGTPLGHIHIWATSTGQMAIDNLKITNLDTNAQLIETEYKSGKWEIPEDYVYQEEERVYLNPKDDKESFSGYIFIPITLGIGIIAVATTILITKRKSAKKEGQVNEK